MGLRILNRLAEGALIESAYEGLAAAPPYLGAEAVNLGRLTAPRYISVRTLGVPGNADLLLHPVSSDNWAEPARYPIRDGEIIILSGEVDYDLEVQIVGNGAVSDTGVLALPVLVSPIPSAIIRLTWGNGPAPVINPPDDQGALCVAIRDTSIPAPGTTQSNAILAPVSGRVSWIADYAVGVAGNIVLIQGGLEQSEALANFGTWDFPDIIAGQYMSVMVRNTGAAGAVNVDLKVVRT